MSGRKTSAKVAVRYESSTPSARPRGRRGVRLRRSCRVRALVGVALLAGLLAISSLAAASAPGQLDPAFGAGGVVLTQLGGGAPAHSGVLAGAAQADGKIVLGGYASDGTGHRQLLLSRLNEDGSFDSTFAAGGRLVVQLGAGATARSEVWALALAPDGRIVVAGDVATGTGRLQVLVARLRPNGDLDSTFGSGGVVTRQLGAGASPNSEARAIALQPDGGIVVAGTASNLAGGDQVLVARLRADGTPDPAFGTAGAVSLQLGAGLGPMSRASAVAVQPDGKLVASGAATDASGALAVMAVRLEGVHGALDPSFGTGGVVRTQLGEGPSPRSQANAMALQPDGKVLVAGFASQAGDTPLLVARLNPDGSPDGSFGTAGIVLRELGVGPAPFSQANALALQPDGRIVATGYASDSVNLDVPVVRLDPDGGPDRSFGTGGAVVPQLGVAPNPISEAWAVALQGDGRIVVAGDGGSDGGDAFLAARFAGDPPPASTATPGPTLAVGATPAAVTGSPRLAGRAGAPRLTRVVQRARRWLEHRPRGEFARRLRLPVGTTFGFSLDRAAGVRLAFTRRPGPAPGGHGRCLGRRGCARPLVGALAIAGRAGPNRLRFRGRLAHGKTLPPGRYAVTLVAIDAAGVRSAPRTLRFTIATSEGGR